MSNERLSKPAVVAALESVLLGEEVWQMHEGARVGVYELKSKLGEGGFGVVWLADQQEPIRREVALKLIKPGIDSEEVLARFQREQQVLARLDHPGIALVFDAGLTPDDRPYIVMELVDGSSLTSHCRGLRLNLAEKLALFCQACSGVQHAHEKGVIHRDLKPSNILVAQMDGSSQVKVIDFGIAKALSYDGQRDLTWMTRQDRLIGTPAYMSPEQTLGGERVDARSDIYALGVILYELIAGYLPFSSQLSLDDKLYHIREVVARPPMNHEDDLNWIVLRCLEKDPARRYATVESLEEDLRHYQEGRPVSAHPPTRLYVFNRWLRRHRVTAAAILIVIMGLISATGLALWQKRRAELYLQAALEMQAVLLTHLDQMIGSATDQGPPAYRGIKEVLDSIKQGSFPGTVVMHEKLLQEGSSAAEIAGDLETAQWARKRAAELQKQEADHE
jgi:serine/threonine protein kinase